MINTFFSSKCGFTVEFDLTIVEMFPNLLKYATESS